MPLDASVPTASGTTGILIVGTDRSGSLAALSTVAQVAMLQATKSFSGTDGKLAVYEAKATDLEDQNFDPVGSMVARFAIQTGWQNSSGTGAALWTNLTMMIEYAVQFRGTV